VSILQLSGTQNCVILTRCQFYHNQLYSFIDSVVRENVDSDEYSFVYVFYIYFWIVFHLNFVGLTPYALPFSSYCLVTAYLSLCFYTGMTFHSYSLYGPSIFAEYLPKDTAVWVKIFLLGIEIISYFTKVISLSVRLFANMVAGHILLGIIGSFVFMCSLKFATLFTFPPIFILIMFFCFLLEVLICFLQAFVYIVLLSMYMNSALNLM
jgi:F-type H+-transporting ATPase subunit a